MNKSANHIVRRTPGSLRPGKTKWARIDALSDAKVEAAARADPDAAPTDVAFWKTARLVMPEGKVPVTFRMDREVLAWFKAQGSRYQTRMNAVLRAYVEARKRSG